MTSERERLERWLRKSDAELKAEYAARIADPSAPVRQVGAPEGDERVSVMSDQRQRAKKIVRRMWGAFFIVAIPYIIWWNATGHTNNGATDISVVALGPEEGGPGELVRFTLDQPADCAIMGHGIRPFPAGLNAYDVPVGTELGDQPVNCNGGDDGGIGFVGLFASVVVVMVAMSLLKRRGKKQAVPVRRRLPVLLDPADEAARIAALRERGVVEEKVIRSKRWERGVLALASATTGTERNRPARRSTVIVWAIIVVLIVAAGIAVEMRS